MRPVWGGKASLEEIEVDGPNAFHWEGMNLFLYNPEAHQWSQFYSNAKEGTIAAPFVGGFKNGRGEFVSTDTWDNRAILTRVVWSNIEANSHDYTEYFSGRCRRHLAPLFHRAFDPSGSLARRSI